MRQLPESWRLARVQSFSIRWIAVSFWPTIERFNLVLEDQQEPKLLAIFGIHVDDLFGAYNTEDPATLEIINNLQNVFKFREWHSGSEKEELTYCGAQISKTSDGHWKIFQGDYFKRQKPITIPKERQNKDLPVTENERTALRGLLGALAWPVTQTAPHLQATTSLLAGEITSATTKILESMNKALRYAKANSDVGLEYRHLGGKDEVTFIAFSRRLLRMPK